MRQGGANARPRTPILPKELIVPVCWRLTLICSVMCASALGIRLFTLWRMHKIAASNMKSEFPLNGSHFFVEIGLSSDAENSRTKHLEESGWRGVCANPFTDQSRSCKAVAMPVAPASGQNIEISDCSVFTGLMSMFSRTSTDCPKVQKSAMSIGEMLLLSKAPPIIDYLALDTIGTEREILETFPFKQFCVRAWTVQHRYEADNIAGILKSLGARGCNVQDNGPAFWARCSCSRFAQSVLEREEKPTRKHVGQVKNKQGRNPKHGEKQRNNVLAPSFEQLSDMNIELDTFGSPSLMRKN